MYLFVPHAYEYLKTLGLMHFFNDLIRALSNNLSISKAYTVTPQIACDLI